MHRIGILGAAGIAPRAPIAPARRRRDVEVAAVAPRRPAAGRAHAEEPEAAFLGAGDGGAPPLTGGADAIGTMAAIDAIPAAAGVARPGNT